MGRRWSEEEDTAIAAVAEEGRHLIDEMARFPGRTYGAVKMRASKIGVSLLEAFIWTEFERAQLRRIYGSDEPIKVGLKLWLPHRGYIAAIAEAQRLGLSGTKKRTGTKGAAWVLSAIEQKLANGRQLTIPELIAATRASPSGIFKALDAARGKTVRVGRWTRRSDVGDWMAVWELGGGADAPRPVPLTPAESNRRWRDRKRHRAGHFDPFAAIARQIAP